MLKRARTGVGHLFNVSWKSQASCEKQAALEQAPGKDEMAVGGRAVVRCSSPSLSFGEKQWCWHKLRGGQCSPPSPGEAREAPLGCWLAPIVRGDGGDGCVLTAG